MKQILLIGLGGALGSIARHLASSFTAKQFSGLFPLPIFLVNITGCVLIGLFLGLFEQKQIISSEMKIFLVTGFCGGYTTFSTFSSENLQLLQNGNFLTLFAYIFLSVAAGILGVWLGFRMANLIH
ncbi:MAG: fluoride efflux transporter CrcB [Flavobacteriaceae bacterium]|jgi:CrcB protein|nr:fluoride efflux transporter CrcB [Flavobacteriaceae bacterium]